MAGDVIYKELLYKSLFSLAKLIANANAYSLLL